MAHISLSSPLATSIDSARYWRTALMPETEQITARYHRQVFAPHWHEGFVIAMIVAGAQRYRYCKENLVAVPGTVGALNPGVVHTGERAGEQGWAYRAFYPSQRWMHTLAESLAGGSRNVPWLPAHTIADCEVAGALVHAHRLLEKGVDLLCAETALIGAFSLLLSRYADVKPEFVGRSQQERGRIVLMQELLAAELGEPLTLSQLGAAVGLSAFHAARLFSNDVGMPPHAWRNQLRLHRACELLRQKFAVAEVAVACGFVDQSHFTRQFKRAYGIAPGRWQAL